MRRWFYQSLGILFAIIIGVTGYAGTLEELDTYFSEARVEWEIPGMAVAIVEDDSVVLARGYGTLTRGGDKQVDPHTLFAVASNTKAFTAALLGVLASENKLEWDDRVIDYLPRFHMNDGYVTRDIRIRDLLVHRSGLPTFGGDLLWIGGGFNSDEIVRRIRFMEPVAPFRAEYHYQNLMFLTAGEVAEAVSGHTWEVFLRNRILDQLGMDETYPSITDLTGLGNVATPHEMVDSVITPISYDSVDAVAPAAGLNSNVLDMAQWMRLNINRGVIDGRRILDSSLVEEMQSVQIPLEPSDLGKKRLGTDFSGYGLGWGISEYHGYKLVAHGGGLSGMISRQAFIPSEGIGVVVLTNFAPHNLTRAVTYRTLDALLGLPETDWSEVYLQQREDDREEKAAEEKELRKKRVEGTTPSVPLKKFAGKYHEDLSGDAHIVMEGNHLVFNLYPRFIGDLRHWNYNTFRVTWRNPIFDMPDETFLTFFLNEEGEVQNLEVTFYHPHTFVKTE